jgi:predicted Zn-dependent protease
MANILTEAQARDLAQRIMGASAAEGVEVRLESGIEGNTRFAVNQLTTAGEVVDTQATVRVRTGQRSGSVSFNALDQNGIEQAVRRAEQLAQLSPEDPEQMPLLGPQPFQPSAAFFQGTRELGPPQRADVVQEMVEGPAGAGLVATGFLPRRARSTTVANTNGLFAYARSTQASLTTTVRTAAGDGSGWAGTTHNEWRRMTPGAELVERAMDKARRSVAAATAQPAPYTVLLEPTAVGNLVQLLARGLSGRSADEGRSAFSRPGGGNRIGERMVDERVTLLSDPADPDLLELPFTDEGEPLGRTTWIENGVLTNLEYGRYWAEQQQRLPVPSGGGLKLEGGTGTVADLVQGVESGVLVTRFWYIRSVDPRTLTYTGLTRDGTFLIEGGRVTRALKNFRFNQSILAMLDNIEAMGAAERVVASGSGGIGSAVVMPPLVVRDFNFTSISDAV